MAIAAAQASAMVGAIDRGLVAACDRLPVVIAEAARHTRRKPGVVQRSKKMIELHFEAPIHASDYVFSHRHTNVFCGLRILPREVLINELDNSSRDSPCLTLSLDRYTYPFRYLDGIDLPRALVNRPEVLVDAVFCQEALVGSFERTRLYI